MLRLNGLLPLCMGLLTLLFVSGCGEKASEQDPSKESPVTEEKLNFSTVYNKVLRPHCLSCHNSGNPKGGLDVSSYEALSGSDALVVGKPDDSLLYLAIKEGWMPKKADPLSGDLAELVKKLIANGASR